MNDAQLALRWTVFEAFAATGAPPDVPDSPDLRALAERHILVLDAAGRIRMAHPFAAHPDGARVEAQGRTWWGNCAWDGFGIVHALKLHEATITAQGVTVHTRDGVPQQSDAVFDVAVPAARWWHDIAHT